MVIVHKSNFMVQLVLFLSFTYVLFSAAAPTTRIINMIKYDQQDQQTTASGLVDQLPGWEPPYPSSIHEAIKVARHYAAMHSWSISHAPQGLVLGPRKPLGYLDLGQKKKQDQQNYLMDLGAEFIERRMDLETMDYSEVGANPGHNPNTPPGTV